MMCKNIVRLNLSTNKVDKKNNIIRFSSFLPIHMKELIKNMNDDEWVFGVQYKEKKDIQIGITGSSNLKENWKRTITRELAEELKLYPNYDMIEDEHEYKYRKKHWFCCKLNVNNSIPSINQTFKQDNEIRDWKKKVGVLVYGKFEKLFEIINNNYSSYIPNDNISHIVIVNIGFVKSVLSMFETGDYFDIKI